MSEQEFLGFFVLALGSIMAVVGTALKIFSPIMKANESIIKLTAAIERQNEIQEGHQSSINEMDKQLVDHERRIYSLERK